MQLLKRKFPNWSDVMNDEAETDVPPWKEVLLNSCLTCAYRSRDHSAQQPAGIMGSGKSVLYDSNVASPL